METELARKGITLVFSDRFIQIDRTHLSSVHILTMAQYIIFHTFQNRQKNVPLARPDICKLSLKTI
jgi:hypothetical protein